jgi:hypothetical protein
MADSESGYKVGPGRPPLYTRFKKGRSGNPIGRRTVLSSTNADYSDSTERKQAEAQIRAAASRPRAHCAS